MFWMLWSNIPPMCKTKTWKHQRTQPFRASAVSHHRFGQLSDELVGCNRGMCSFQMKLNINGIRWEKNQHTTNKQWGGRHHQKQTHVKSSVKLGLINQHFLFCTCLVPFQMGISAIKYDKVSKNIPLFHWRQRICIRKNRLIPKLFVPSGLTCW